MPAHFPVAHWPKCWIASMAAVTPPSEAEWLESLGTEVTNARCKVYLLTFSRLLPETLQAMSGELRSLERLTRKQLVKFVRDAFENPGPKLPQPPADQAKGTGHW